MSKKLLGALTLGIGGYFGKGWLSGGVNTYEPDMTGKVIIVTGGNSGIGKVAARKFYELNAEVIITGRSVKKAEDFLNSIPEDPSKKKIQFHQVDFSDLKNVEQFTNQILKKYDHIDVLVNNAGSSLSEYQVSKEGIEMTTQSNHLAPVYLTSLLLPSLFHSKDSRVVNVASAVHTQGRGFRNIEQPPNFRDLWMNKRSVDYSKDYSGSDVYIASKLNNVLFTKGLSDLFATKKKEGKVGKSDITSYCLHPGVVRTNFFRFLEGSTLGKIGLILAQPLFLYFLKSEEQGAQTTLHCCLAPKDVLEDGGYYADCARSPESDESKDQSNIDELWSQTNLLLQELTGKEVFGYDFTEE